MSYAIGIDLGTTNSTVSVFRRGALETLPVEGKMGMPSVVSFLEGSQRLVGLAAKSKMMVDPEHTVASAKRFMGDRDKRYNMYGESFTVVDIASMVLKRLVESACKELDEDVRDVVITVPAYFTEAQREDTKRAGEQAGLNVLRLIPEPTAAAIAYGLNQAKDQKIMVYDLGGGTFDISILKVQKNNFLVEAVGGDSRLGGDDFDQAIMDWAIKRFKKQTGIDAKSDNSRDARVSRQRLKEAAENAKIELAEANSTSIIIPDFFGKPLELELSLEEFNSLCEPLLTRTIKLMKSVLADAKLRADAIDRVILVGGSTKMRAVRECVTKAIKEPYVAERVDEVVSHGAAVRAANFYLPEEDKLPVHIEDRIGHSLGVELLNDKNELEFHPVIPRQTQYPCRKGFLGQTSRPMQTEALMRVFRGEDRNPEKNAYLGKLSLPVSPPQKNLVPLVGIFELDEDGIIKFTAVQLPPGPTTEQILAGAYKEELDLTPVDKIIASGNASVRSVSIKNE